MLIGSHNNKAWLIGFCIFPSEVSFDLGAKRFNFTTKRVEMLKINLELLLSNARSSFAKQGLQDDSKIQIVKPVTPGGTVQFISFLALNFE